jgi:hypothetical protein
MRTIQTSNRAAVLGVLLATTFVVRADNSTLQQKLGSEYALTSINAEGGVVTQGVTLSLKADGLIAGATYACASEYKGGKLALSSKVCSANRMADRIKALPWVGGHIPDAPQGTTIATRRFVRDEKFYVTQIQAADEVYFSLVSDAIDNVTYKAEIRFKTLDLGQADRMIAEVFGVTRPDSQPQGGQQVAAAASTPAPIQSRLRDDAPPRPPVQEAPPTTVSFGLSTDQVVGLLGQPREILDAGSKKIYLYKDLKVTVVDGKVTDAQSVEQF